MRVVLLTAGKGVGKWTRPRSWAKSRREVWCFVKAGMRWQLVTDPRLGTWYAGYYGHRAFVPAWDHWPGFRGLFMIPRKKIVQAAAEVDHLASVETKLLAKYGPLIAHIAATRYDDGTARKPGQVLISVQGDMWCVDCRDRDTCKRVRALAPDIDKALALASALVAAPDTPWEDADWLATDAPKKKK